ncbi:hypothetical protein FACS1894179_09170 [Bacteroidia bacterium]|nr:hypothetical protein FACS1894179_09170 [Bacteroidia bacterium]
MSEVISLSNLYPVAAAIVGTARKNENSAAILANLAITGVIYYVTTIMPEAISIVKMHELIIVYGLVIISGITITSVATAWAVNRYLRMTTNKLYHV